MERMKAAGGNVVINSLIAVAAFSIILAPPLKTETEPAGSLRKEGQITRQDLTILKRDVWVRLNNGKFWIEGDMFKNDPNCTVYVRRKEAGAIVDVDPREMFRGVGSFTEAFYRRGLLEMAIASVCRGSASQKFGKLRQSV